MLFVCAGIFISFRFWQLLKADSSMVLTEAGNSIPVNASAFWKAPLPMVVISALVGKVIDVRFSHPLKAASSMVSL